MKKNDIVILENMKSCSRASILEAMEEMEELVSDDSHFLILNFVYTESSQSSALCSVQIRKIFNS